jgi:hypothetical protein
MNKHVTSKPFSSQALKRGREGLARVVTMALVTFILVYVFLDIIFGK